MRAADQAGLIRSDVITGYHATATEPDLHDLLLAARDSGATVLLPRVHGTELQWVTWTTMTTFQSGPLGFEEPAGQPVDAALVTRSSMMFIPALAVDHTGRRLGQGGGFFDRLLARIPHQTAGGPLRVAVVFDTELIAEVPGESHDQHVDAVLTPTRFIRC
jgi:5-formyltetrahydrofolate cyclo-ligase